jgi:hypothetical protein
LNQPGCYLPLSHYRPCPQPSSSTTRCAFHTRRLPDSLPFITHSPPPSSRHTAHHPTHLIIHPSVLRPSFHTPSTQLACASSTHHIILFLLRHPYSLPTPAHRILSHAIPSPPRSPYHSHPTPMHFSALQPPNMKHGTDSSSYHSGACIRSRLPGKLIDKI